MQRDLNIFKPTYLSDLIRLGRAFDGGYVINERVIKQTQILFGLGVRDDWSFEEDFQKKKQDLRIFCFDGSIGHVGDHFPFRQMKQEAAKHLITDMITLNIETAKHRINTIRSLLHVSASFKNFFSKPNNTFVSKYVSTSKDSKNISPKEIFELASKIEGAAPNSCFLKMDIEGAEFDVLPEFLKFNDYINSIVVEFHDLGKRWNEFEQMLSAIKKDYAVVHVHGNNFSRMIDGTLPDVIELTLLKKSLFQETQAVEIPIEYPIKGLDYPCNSNKLDFKLVFSQNA